ncbi:polysaccharide biosynthesis tyrosine autokinase [Microbulbifer bruguierae]|uniref:non-specific protein-tyrosine kinase n=1 Tax=Microbulbifer bruguierae TaxID=3029061 RepID=A0ABY8NHF0_9GAMM|nr:polysaccharide biosynthesis tyrosine autokinase [Microbulbifer bruguierae]WGL18238.1 polysaccharide biosynthesis tyrosine autokinase [Microbulbifer bruguierae]
MNYPNGNNDGDEPLLDQGPDLQRFGKVLFAQRWMITGLTVAITAAAIAVIAAIPPRYQATASLVFEVDQANPVAVDEIYDAGPQRRDYILTQTEILQSRQLAERVIQRLELMKHPEFSIPTSRGPLSFLSALFGADTASESPAPSQSLAATTSAFLKRLTIEPARNTNLVRIKFEAESADLAALAANTLVEEFVVAQSEAKAQFTSRATSWLNERLETLRGKLEVSENQLQAFRESEDLVDISGVRGLAERDLDVMTTQLQEMRQELKRITSVHQQFETLAGNEMALANLPEVIGNPLIQEIKRNEAAAQRNVAELARRYKSKHPEMITAQNELDMVREQLAAEVRNLADAVTSQYETALSRVRAQELEVERAKQNYQKVSHQEFRYQELVREVEINRQLYDTFFTRVNETRETSGFDIAPARFVDAAVVPNSPEKPNKSLLAAVSLFMALFFSTALAFLLDMLRLGVRGPDDVEISLGQQLIGVIPDMKKLTGIDLHLRTFFDPEQYAFGEAIRTLRTSVVLSSLAKSRRVIAVTSSVPAEGKTTVTENLGFALAQVEKVLLVDADLRRPVVGIDFETAREHPGLTNLIEGTHSIDECVYHDSYSGLDIMPAGTYYRDPQKLLVSPQFAEKIHELSEIYDRVIIDTPPVKAVSDALIISRVSDALLYVVKYDSTKKRIVKKGIDRFIQIGTQVDGVVLTHADVGKDSIYSDEYYGYEYYMTPKYEMARSEKSEKKSDPELKNPELETADDQH